MVGLTVDLPTYLKSPHVASESPNHTPTPPGRPAASANPSTSSSKALALPHHHHLHPLHPDRPPINTFSAQLIKNPASPTQTSSAPSPCKASLWPLWTVVRFVGWHGFGIMPLVWDHVRLKTAQSIGRSAEIRQSLETLPVRFIGMGGLRMWRMTCAVLERRRMRRWLRGGVRSRNFYDENWFIWEQLNALGRTRY